MPNNDIVGHITLLHHKKYELFTQNEEKVCVIRWFFVILQPIFEKLVNEERQKAESISRKRTDSGA